MSLFTAGCECDRPSPVDGGGTDGGMMEDGGGRDGGMPSSLFTPPTITTCPGDSLPPPASGRCEVTPGGDATLITGDILTPGEVFRGGQVLVGADGRIACVGCDCAAMGAGATALVCPDVVVSPGLINAHDHVTYIDDQPAPGSMERYEHRHDWRRGADGHTEVDTPRGTSDVDRVRWLELRQLIAGTTSIFGEVDDTRPTGLLRNLDHVDLLEGLSDDAPNYKTFPLGDLTGFKETTCSYDPSGTSGAVFVPHIAEGIDEAAQNEFRCTDGQGTGDNDDFMEPRTAIVHGVGLHAGNVAIMAENEVELIWSPRSNISLYGDTARVTTLAYLGVPIGLGNDWLTSGSMNLLRELRCADAFNANNLGGFFPDEQLWLMATRGSAQALQMDDSIGTIAVGLHADLAFYAASARRDHRAVLGADPQDVVLVMRGGRVLYGDADVVGALETGCDDFTIPGGFADVCGTAKRVCLGEVGTTFAALSAGRSSEYDLFFCGEPAGEPTCLPSRNFMGSATIPDASDNGSNYYAGMSSADDVDGDGLANAMDNCEAIFNPIRPMDDGVQSDVDGDGLGDECDPEPFDATDLDGDGVDNAMDNCPELANDQMDRDGDGLGDACDGCPDRSVPAGEPSVYAVRCGATAGMVALEDLLVTAVAADGFFAQVLETAPTYDGVDYSGIFVFTDDPPTVAVGDVVDVTGPVGEFFGLDQIGTPADAPVITPVSSGMTPVALVVDTADVVTTGPRATALQSVFVRVETVTAMGGLDMFDEFAVDDGLLIGDSLYLVAPAPMAGSMFEYVQGPLTFAFANTKILPRGPADVGGGDFALLPDAIATAPLGTVTITVVLADDAPAGGAPIVLTSAPPTLLGCAPLTIPAGMRSGTTTCTAGAAEGSGTLTASFGGDMDVSTVGVAAAPVLFFSEYVEGNSNNKAIEIVNAGGSAADLSTCQLRRYTNGAATVGGMYAFTGMLAAGDAFVVCNGSLEGAATRCDATSGAITHNGNDAYDLFCGGMVVDTFGQIGTDPGDEWTGGGLGTLDYVLTRACTVTMGDTDGSDAFDPSVGWTGAAWVDAATSLGGLGNRSECP